MIKPGALHAVAERIQAAFAQHRVQLTLGGEPTFVPINPDGPEWNITALGPTKLRYAYALAEALILQSLPAAISFYSPGKFYPGELNPRWTINLLWKRDGSPFAPEVGMLPGKKAAASAAVLEAFKGALCRTLRVKGAWLRAIDPLQKKRPVWVLPLDHDGTRFRSANWHLGTSFKLLSGDAPAGLRLPLQLLPEHVSKRALTLELRDGETHVFLPPLLQAPFLFLLQKVVSTLHKTGGGPAIFAGYIPWDEAKIWTQLALTPDPGVLEVNLPPCAAWAEYDHWMQILEKAAASAGLRSFKQVSPEETLGTGGGNHLLFGGPDLDSNAFFTNPGWVTSLLRYWQHHPSLSYLFTGQYVGPSSQAPRPDESTRALYDLEMAYQFLEKLPPGDHRMLLSETLRHLHTDGTGNTHRSELSFDKFWNVNFEGGCRGLIEFRAIESLPHAEWMSAIALLWRALAAYLLARPFRQALIDHGERLHDYFFLPACLWADFEMVLRDLRKAGFDLPLETYRAIADWRLPEMLTHSEGNVTLTIRKALEGWPLLCETPLEGGNTSRFVDTSIERLEFLANKAFVESHEIYIQGRRLGLHPFPKGQFGVGLRYRRTALYPSLHPGVLPQLPLMLLIKRRATRTLYKLEASSRCFEPAASDLAPALSKRACTRLHAGLLTCDLRLP